MSHFGAVVGERTPQGRDEFLRYYNAAIELPSPALSRIETISKDTGVFLVVGVIERDGGTLYCTVIFVDPVEGFICKHRKLMPTAAERMIWGQGGPDTLPVVERQFVSDQANVAKANISATICW
jgi:predicted amidohydrolase